RLCTNREKRPGAHLQDFRSTIRAPVDIIEPFGWCGRLRTDSKFLICDADEKACELLHYERDDLIGRSILITMPPLVAKIHKDIFRALKLASPQEVQKHAKNLVADMARCRKFVVMDSSNEPIDCSVSALLDMDLSSTLILRQVAGKVLHTVPRGFASFL
ncbi:unnamed protein product, partial [Polarella glacialis]